MTEYLVFLLAFAASAAAPGPETAGLMARALGGGMLASLPRALGIVLGKLLMLTAAIVGLAALVDLLGPFFAVLKYAGAAYLIWLGVRRWRRAGEASTLSGAAEPVRFGVDVGLGLAMTLSNPIAILFYLALLPGVVDIAGLTLNGYAILCLIVVGVMAAVTISYGILAEAVRKAFSSSRSKAGMDRATGAMLIGAGTMIGTR